MKKCVSLFLVILFFTGHYHMRQMARLPFLIAHVHHHQHIHGDSIQDFYMEHYEGKDHDQHDAGDDARLPFKGYTSTPVLSFIVQQVPESLQPLPSFKMLFTALIFQRKNESYREHWQPPC
jgi:hypothetical protein